MSKLTAFAQSVSQAMYNLDGSVKSAITSGEAKAYAMRAGQLSVHNGEKDSVTRKWILITVISKMQKMHT